MPVPRGALAAVLVLAVGGSCALGLSGAASPAAGSAAARQHADGRAAGGSRLDAVGAEAQYANVVSQIGGRYVHVSAVMTNPSTDPHAFEASASVAREVAAAELVVQNGAGYDSFMSTIEQADPNPSRKVVDVQRLLGLPSSTRNPHLWYDPATMPAVAAAVARDLAGFEPSHKAYFARRLGTFDRSLSRWTAAIGDLRRRFAGTPVATTEPVVDDMLQAAGIVNRTPFSFQADIMNGVDPSPQAITSVEGLLAGRKVRALVYNQQVTDTLTRTLLAIARSHEVPVVGVYETMPSGFTYQGWMLAEVHALAAAFEHGTSAPGL